jgi:lipopolysaccharide transport system permease protein
MHKITIYSPDSAVLKPGKLVRQMFKDLVDSRDLALRLAKRDISAQYRQSYLGYFWAFFIPLINSLVWLYLQGSGIVKLADTGIPYPIYVFTGTMLWQILTESLQSPIVETNAAKGMLSKLNFPKEAILLNGILKTLFNSGIKLAILIPVILFLGVRPDWTIIFFPFAILSLILVGNAIGILLSPIGMLYTDIGRAIPLVTQFLMFFSPVVFAMPKEGITSRIFELNPLSSLLITARAWLTGTENEYLVYFIGVNICAIILLFFGWIIYKLTMPILVERMSA